MIDIIDASSQKRDLCNNCKLKSVLYIVVGLNEEWVGVTELGHCTPLTLKTSKISVPLSHAHSFQKIEKLHHYCYESKVLEV
jgi:hypothetical protein